jgi:hypothetical protein
MKELKAQVKNNPTRIRVPKYGKGLMLLMEAASRYNSTPLCGQIKDVGEYFDLGLRMTSPAAQSIKKYINSNI